MWSSSAPGSRFPAISTSGLVLALGAFIFAPTLEASAASCSELKSLKLDGATVTSADAVNAGSLSVSYFGLLAVNADVPAFCRVKGVAAEAIGYEVWLPAEGWNGRMLSIGNAGFGGAVSTAQMAEALSKGYAVTGNDTGHQGTGKEWMADPVRVRHWSHDATHLVTQPAKDLVRTYYGAPAKFAYFEGCSTGGAQGMEEAEFYPADYNGIVSGAPALAYTRLFLSLLWGLKAAERPEAHLSFDALKILHSAVLKACDANDGVQDGLISDPLACHFDPAQLTCRAGESLNCLTPAQVETARAIYQGPRNPRTGESIFPGLPYGSEADPALTASVAAIPLAYGWGGIQGPLAQIYPIPFLRGIVHHDPSWDWHSFDWDKDVAELNSTIAPNIDASNADLRPFAASGGKLLMFQGWGDPLLSGKAVIDYRAAVLEQYARHTGSDAAAPGKVEDFYRLFMLPGMAHCGGGPGPSKFDDLTAIRAWVEDGKAPQGLVAETFTIPQLSAGQVLKISRPICSYPLIARWTGHGDPNVADNFTCEPAKTGH
jgi:feruloyl esterase